MVESQSRYGIMEELNSKKLTEKTALAKLEAERENNEVQKQEEIANIERALSSREATYEQEHSTWKQKRILELKSLENEYKRTADSVKEEIKEKDNSYKKEYKDWKEGTQRQLESANNLLTKYLKMKDREINSKKEIITEIDEGIKSLKEMSKEQKETK